MDFGGDLYHITYSRGLFHSMEGYFANPELLRFDAFLFGYILLDLNKALFFFYNELIIAILPKAICWPAVVACKKIVGALLYISWEYYLAYMFSNFLLVAFYTFFFLITSLWHFFLLFFITKRLVKFIFFFFFKCIKCFFAYALVEIWVNSYLFLLAFIDSRRPKGTNEIYKQRKRQRKKRAWGRVVYWTVYHIYVSFLDGWAPPAGGFILNVKSLWGFPEFVYWSKLSLHKDGLGVKQRKLNLWSRLKVAQNEILGAKEKRWWFFLASWKLAYILRYYYFFMFFFIFFKKLRLIYFFVIFFFKFFFFKFLKYFLEFHLLCGLLEIFIWYYMQLRLQARDFVPFFFYDLLWATYIYSKSYFAMRFVLIDLHYWFYRFLMFFTPTNYGFVGSQNLYDHPFDVRFNKLRDFFWYRYDRSAYSTPYSLSFLTWQHMVYFCFFYFINKLGEKAFLWGYHKAITLCKGNTPINAAIIKAHFFYGYFLALCLIYLEGLKKQQIYIHFSYLLIKLHFLKGKLISKKLLRAFNILQAVKLLAFLALFFITFFYLAKFFCFFLSAAKAPLPLARLLIYKVYLGFMALIGRALLNKLLFYYLLFFVIFFFFVSYNSEKAWRRAHMALIVVVWAASFFYFYLANLLINLASFFIFINKKFKLWVFFIIFFLLSLDFEFFGHLFLGTASEILCYVESTVVDFYFWVDNAIHSSWYLPAEAFESSINKRYDDICENYGGKVKDYQAIVFNYMWRRYWREELAIIQNCIKQARQDPYTWGGALLMVLFTDEVPTYEDYVKTPLPTFHRLPYNAVLLLYYKSMLFSALPAFEYRTLEIKHRAIGDIWILLCTFISKTFFEIKWRFLVDIPYFFGLDASAGRYAGFLNFLVCEMPSKALNLFSYYYNLAFTYIYFLFNYRLKDSLFEGFLFIFGHLANLWENFSDLFNINFFKGYDSNMWVFFYIKAQKIIQLSDIYNKSFYRMPSDWLKGRFLDKRPHIDVTYHHHLSTWKDYIESDYFEAWYLYQPDIVMPSIGRWSLLRTWDSLRLYGINNIKRFCFLLGGHYLDGFFMPSPLFYRSILPYLYFCFFSLFLTLYLFIVHVIGWKNKAVGKWEFLGSSKTNVWSHIRSPLFKKRIAWVDDFSMLASVAVSDIIIPYESGLVKRKWNKDGSISVISLEGESWEQKFYYCFHRYLKTMLKLISKYKWGLKWKKKRGWRKIRRLRRSWAFEELHGNYIRLQTKLLRYIKAYKSRPIEHVWSKPFIFREFFFEKGYKDYISIAERNQDIFKTFLNYELDLTFQRTSKKYGDIGEESAKERDIGQVARWDVNKKHGGAIFERLVWGSYYQRLPLPALTKEDTYMVEEYMKKIFDFFHKLDRAFFRGKGSYLLLHKDPGNDTFSYNEQRRVAFQTIEDPYELNFKIDIVLWELVGLVYGCWWYAQFVESIPPMEEEYDDFIYQALWFVSFFEHFDFLHAIINYLVASIPFSSSLYNWDQANGTAEEHITEGYEIISIDVDQFMRYYFTLPDYWLREALCEPPSLNFFGYIMKELLNFINNHALFLSISNVNSYILLAYYAVRYAVIATFVIYYFIKKFFGVSIKNKKLYFYTEYSMFYLSHFKGFIRAKCKIYYNYRKKKEL